MFGKSHNSSSSSSNARNKPARWRIFCLALVIAFCIGSLGPMAPVKAQDEDPDEFQFFVDVINPLQSRPMCVGETREYHVRIVERGKIGPKEPEANASITLGPGTSITAKVADSSIADVTSARTMVINSPSPTKIRPAVVAFTIKAEKKGNTTIDFSAVVSLYNHTLPTKPFTSVPIEVQNCKFKVSAVQQAVVAGGADFNIVAMIDGAEIKADQSGHFTGTAAVNWVGAASSIGGGPCSASINVAPSGKAELTGNMNDGGQLALSMIYQAPGTSTTATCEGISVSQPTPLNAVPLQFSVPNSGGVITLSGGMMEFTGTCCYPGSAVITVIPEEDQAPAFMPGDHLAGSDDFSNFFGVLAALP